MESIRVRSLADFNLLMKDNAYLSNGKNIQVDHLYETAAQSKWKPENLFGIYLSRENFLWMSAWMAIVSRKKAKKRQIRYFRPDTGKDDRIGAIEIYSPNGPDPELFCKEAYLYLFRDGWLNVPRLDISMIEREEKLNVLLGSGFSQRLVSKDDAWKLAYKPEFKHKLIVYLDEWQVALINFSRIVPDKEIILDEKLIVEMASRVKYVSEPIEDYYLK